MIRAIRIEYYSTKSTRFSYLNMSSLEMKLGRQEARKQKSKKYVEFSVRKLESDIFGDNIDGHVLNEHGDDPSDALESDGDSWIIAEDHDETPENLNFDLNKRHLRPQFSAV